MLKSLMLSTLALVIKLSVAKKEDFSHFTDSAVKVSTTPRPLVDFKLSIPLPYEHMNPVSVSWLSRHHSLVKNLFSNGHLALRNALRSETLESPPLESTNDEYSPESWQTLPTDREVQLPSKSNNAPPTVTTGNALAGNAGQFNGFKLRLPEQASRDFANVPEKRTSDIECDISRATLNMLVHYLKAGIMCGSRGLRIRFGLG